MHQEFLLPPVDAANHHVDAEKASMYGSALDREFSGGFPPYKILAKMLLPALDQGDQINTPFRQANLDLTIVACALERYRIANGQYPDSLAAISPKFIATVPAMSFPASRSSIAHGRWEFPFVFRRLEWQGRRRKRGDDHGHNPAHGPNAGRTGSGRRIRPNNFKAVEAALRASLNPNFYLNLPSCLKD